MFSPHLSAVVTLPGLLSLAPFPFAQEPVLPGVGQAMEETAAMLSPGTFGHGGGWGTQAWVDPVKGMAYLLMVQRANFPNSDASDVRRVFQDAAAKALARP